MVRITDPEKSRGFYEALGFRFERDMDIVRNGELEATNYFYGIGDQESVLELTFNHDGRTYDLGTGYVWGMGWPTDVSLLSAAWLVLAFVAGSTQRDPRRAALLGLGCTAAALVGYFLMTDSPAEGAHYTLANARGFFVSEHL